MRRRMLSAVVRDIHGDHLPTNCFAHVADGMCATEKFQNPYHSVKTGAIVLGCSFLLFALFSLNAFYFNLVGLLLKLKIKKEIKYHIWHMNSKLVQFDFFKYK